MRWFSKFAVVVAICLLIVGVGLPVTQAASLQNSELIRVTVNISIENPDYFWQYPFAGKQLDSIRIAGMGKSFYIQHSSGDQKIEFDVPRDYKLRIAIGFQNDNATYQEIAYHTKSGIDEKNNSLEIILKAPEAKAVIVKSSSFDEIRK